LVARSRYSGLQGLLGTSRRLTVVSLLGGLDSAGTDCSSALQSLSDHVLSYPVAEDGGPVGGVTPTTTTSDNLVEQQLEGAAAMRQQLDHVAAMGSRAIAQQMVANALVAEVVDRLKDVMDAEHDM